MCFDVRVANCNTGISQRVQVSLRYILIGYFGGPNMTLGPFGFEVQVVGLQGFHGVLRCCDAGSTTTSPKAKDMSAPQQHHCVNVGRFTGLSPLIA